MKFGLMPAAAVQYPREVSPASCLNDCLEQVGLAKAGGFDSIIVGQTPLCEPFYTLHPVPVLGRIAAESGQMRIGTGVLLLPLLNPVDVAEYVATLDIITGGRFIFGIGLGYREVETRIFGIAHEERASRLEEALEIITKLWEGSEISFRGKYYSYDRLKATLRPLKKPPIWLGANGDKAIRRAALIADAWMAPPHNSFSTLQRQMALYHEALKDNGKDFPPADLPIIKELHMAENSEKAIQEARPFLERKYKTYISWGQDKALVHGDSFKVPFEQFISDYRFVLGNADYCIDIIDKHAKLGFNHIVLRVQWPGFPHNLAMRTIRLFSEKVIPYFMEK